MSTDEEEGYLGPVLVDLIAIVVAAVMYTTPNALEAFAFLIASFFLIILRIFMSVSLLTSDSTELLSLDNIIGLGSGVGAAISTIGIGTSLIVLVVVLVAGTLIATIFLSVLNLIPIVTLAYLFGDNEEVSRGR